jgi:light-regulated signal transduction histidine kinase (bacteriophytochrome)
LNVGLERRVPSARRARGGEPELEAFSYSVSHDLRAPLRSIDSFSKALLEDYLPKLAMRERIFCIASATRASAWELIDDLLCFRA